MKLQHVFLSLSLALVAPLSFDTAAAQGKPAAKSEPSANEVAESVQKFYDKTKNYFIYKIN